MSTSHVTLSCCFIIQQEGREGKQAKVVGYSMAGDDEVPRALLYLVIVVLSRSAFLFPFETIISEAISRQLERQLAFDSWR